MGLKLCLLFTSLKKVLSLIEPQLPPLENTYKKSYCFGPQLFLSYHTGFTLLIKYLSAIQDSKLSEGIAPTNLFSEVASSLNTGPGSMLSVN